ncbi:Ubiquitin carboxyl-terminal hydrolase-related protein [Abeliophyllum distichum]|uniref:Ubiquitin carboxyl-terminal hydrolase-related protein n=1 Tax=Abeliophyllum distichum TaxID=126358 RepID=A0ABD1V712_9LAMI
MGHKKRNTAPRAKSSQPPPASPTAADPVAASIDGGANPKPPDLDSRKIAATPSSSHDSIKLECERALTALRRGNHTKALRLMKDLCSKHGSSPLLASIHRVMGDVCVVAASIINDTNSKERHLKNAKESARKSVTLSPNSIEFSHFYANLLFETANEGKDYQEVVQECERALAIENPIDPAKETLQEESYQKIFSAEVRVAHVQNELRSLIEKSNNAYECCQNISKAEARVVQLQNELQSLINTAPGCHEKISTAEASIVHVQNEVWSLIQKFRSIPMRSTRDPIELTSVMTRWPNDIKKSTKTPEERRKEIEVRVAAALLLQQKSESPQCGNDGDNNNIDSNKGLDSGSGMGPRVGEERKSGNTRRNIHPAEIRDWFRSYWNSMNLDGKKKLLRVGISDLKAHFSKERSVSKVLNEALYFGKENKVWKYWLCCCCYEKFAYADSHRQHVMQEHMRTLLPKLHSILPHRAENEWAEMLLNCSWKPLDLKAAIKMLEEQSKFQAPTGKKKLGDNSNDCTQESKELEDVKCIDSDENQGRKKSFLYKSWPSTDDPKRAGLLESIHAIFQLLIKHNHLVSSHLSEVIRYAVEVLQGLDSGSQLLNSNMDQTPLCICFLGAPDLEKILGFLQEIVQGNLSF